MPTITGTGEADLLTGTDEADIISALAGNDIVDGAGGADSMSGGTGDDIYLVDNAGDAVTELAGEGTDEVRSSVDFTLSAHVENLILTGGAINGVGNSLNNVMTGNGQANVFRGGGGSDIFLGGAGNDLYYVQGSVTIGTDGSYMFTGVDQVVENAGDGIDQIVSNVSYSLGANLENLRLTGTLNLTGFGNELDNRIMGNSGTNFLRGLAGDDYLDGGAGADFLDGGDGDDTYVIDHINDHFAIESPAEAGGIDTVISSIDHALEYAFENLTLTGDAIEGTGNLRNNRLIGNAQSNVLLGDGGDDRIEGHAGDDDLDGGFGLDLIFGGAGADTILGRGGNDRIYGDDGDDLIDGGFDADIMYGGAGDDSFVVDNARDIVAEKAGEGIDEVSSTVTLTLKANVENLALAGTANLGGRGNELANEITGNPGANTLRGMAGDDLLFGGAGNDWLEGGAGRDELSGGAGSDRYVFREGDFGGSSFATADIIRDFGDHEGDRIRLDLVDADSGTLGDQDFTFIGAETFTGTAGELRYEQSGGNTYVSGDTNGDGVADFMIRLDGLHVLGSDDFLF